MWQGADRLPGRARDLVAEADRDPAATARDRLGMKGRQGHWRRGHGARTSVSEAGRPGAWHPGLAGRAAGQPREIPRVMAKPTKCSRRWATPGGYGGKPPGVAFIGVPTGARNAGNGALTGDQSTDMNGTTKRPPMCKDPITT